MNKKQVGRPIEKIYPTMQFQHCSIKKIFDTLSTKGVVVIPSFGRFEVRKLKSRKTYHNFAEKVIIVKGRKRIHFTPLGKLKNICK